MVLPNTEWGVNRLTELVASESSNMINTETREPLGTNPAWVTSDPLTTGNNPNGSNSLDPEPEDEVLTFELRVNKAGNNTCGPYGVNPSWSFLCNNWPNRQCTTLGSTNESVCTDTSASYCTLSSSVNTCTSIDTNGSHTPCTANDVGGGDVCSDSATRTMTN